MTDTAIIPREKACFYWNDVPSGDPAADVLVLSFDDPERDRKSARFENSTGAPLVAGFLENESAESIFVDYLGDEARQSLDPELWGKVYSAWLSEFQKVQGFEEPDGEPDFKWITFTGTKDEIDDMEGMLLAIWLSALDVSAMCRDRSTENGYEIWLSRGDAEHARRIGKDLEGFLFFDRGCHGGIKIHLPPVVIGPAEYF